MIYYLYILSGGEDDDDAFEPYESLIDPDTTAPPETTTTSTTTIMLTNLCVGSYCRLTNLCMGSYCRIIPDVWGVVDDRMNFDLGPAVSMDDGFMSGWGTGRTSRVAANGPGGGCLSNLYVEAGPAPNRPPPPTNQTNNPWSTLWHGARGSVGPTFFDNFWKTFLNPKEDQTQDINR